MGITILVVDDEENARTALETYLTPLGYDVAGVGTLTDARKQLNIGNADVVLLDVELPDGFGPNLLIETSTWPSRPPIILITGYPDIEIAVDAMKNGALDFLIKPIKLDRLEFTIKKAVELVSMRRELAMFKTNQKKDFQFVPSKNPKVQHLFNLANRAATTGTHVLITGETGVGKEIFAKYVYNYGSRTSKPFVAINCAAMQDSMLESELFGYEANAFTGADSKRKHGLMETADGGVLFLDEIASMSLALQAKLLRAIETQSFRRVGGTQEVKVDVQIVAASNRDLHSLIKEEKFREDLYYRLHVLDLDIPPLRTRKEDIPELVGFFIRIKNQKLGKNIEDITPRAMQLLMDYDWPGNIRELSNEIELALIMCDSAVLDVNHFHEYISVQ
jgi:DNA-binding NtrC family response regulator